MSIHTLHIGSVLATVVLSFGILRVSTPTQKAPHCSVDSRGRGQVYEGDSAMPSYQQNEKESRNVALCECGCGQPVGINRGKPNRFLRGHSTRIYPVANKRGTKHAHVVCGIRCRSQGERIGIGQKFGRLTIIGEQFRIGDNWRAVCECDCGTITAVAITYFDRHENPSCGCRKAEVTIARNTTHGRAGRNSVTRLYQIWSGMKQRCNDPGQRHYRWYGGKGIKVCEEWLCDFSTFEAWAIANGYAPNLTIDRIDSSAGYDPNNCQWITQAENTRRASRKVVA